LSSVPPSAARGRLLVVLAALLWSLSGAFAQVLTKETPLGLHEPRLEALQLAAWRSLSAGVVLVPLVRPRSLTLTRPAVLTAAAFTAMSALYVKALVEGPAANAIWLQYTAPLWVAVAAALGLGEGGDRRGLLLVLAGLVVILVGGWQGGQTEQVLCGLGAGVFYALVMIGLRAQPDASPVWLTVLNHLTAGLVLLPFTLACPTPSPAQFLTLFLFGAVQMGLPYWLMTRGLRSVSPQEAGLLALVEPVLMPLWSYLATRHLPEPDVPGPYTCAGAGLILAALLYRYWPRRAPLTAPAV
jgi:drug/metabolite transporter (DMT)-like permease